MDKSIKEIKEEFDICDFSNYLDFAKKYEDDSRSGISKLVKQAITKYEKYQKELERLYEIKTYERNAYDIYGENALVAGIDEVGRGPLAGPVVAACVILPKDCNILYINDSKKLSEKKREELDKEIRRQAIDIGIGIVSEKEIDELNILQATYKAMREAIGQLKKSPDMLLNDAVTIPLVDVAQTPIIKGDAKSISIAAASIIAKVYRDNLMKKYDEIYPGYDFASNKGYGSAKHIEALKKVGPCEIHRNTFIKNFI